MIRLVVPFLLLSLSLSLALACSKKETQRKAVSGEVAPAAATTTEGEAPPPELAFKNAKMFQGHLLGGQPSAEQLAAAAKAGYKMVIGLQVASEPGVAELERTIRELGLEYVHIPIAGPDSLVEPNARKLSEAIVRGEKAGKVMVVCRSGNRVGALFALEAHYVDGVAPEKALALGDAAGLTSLRGEVAARLGVVQ